MCTSISKITNINQLIIPLCRPLRYTNEDMRISIKRFFCWTVASLRNVLCYEQQTNFWQSERVAILQNPKQLQTRQYSLGVYWVPSLASRILRSSLNNRTRMVRVTGALSLTIMHISNVCLQANTPRKCSPTFRTAKRPFLPMHLLYMSV